METADIVTVKYLKQSLIRTNNEKHIFKILFFDFLIRFSANKLTFAMFGKKKRRISNHVKKRNHE